MLIQWRASSHRLVAMSSPSSGWDGSRRSRGSARPTRTLGVDLPLGTLLMDYFRSKRALRADQKVKHSNRLPIELKPSRGGAGGPNGWPADASWSGPPGVDESNLWLIDASVGRPKTASMNLSTEACSYSAGSMCPGLANGEITQVGTRMPRP